MSIVRRVRVGNYVSEWFPVNVALIQGCVMSPWLLNVYMYYVVREVNVRVLGKDWSCSVRMVAGFKPAVIFRRYNTSG